MTTISPLPDPPSRADPANFAARGDAFMAALPTFQSETNLVAGEVNADAATASSAASTATTQAGIATTQASNALASANSAAASFDSFDDRYLGAKTADPTLDNDDNALIQGALYFNSLSSEFRGYTGSVWVPVLTAASTAELTNKTLTASVAKGTWTASGTWTLPAFTLGGAVSSTGNPSLNIGTGALTAGTGSFSGTTTISSSSAEGGRLNIVSTDTGGIGYAIVSGGSTNTAFPTGALTIRDTTAGANRLVVSSTGLAVTGGISATVTSGAALTINRSSGATINLQTNGVTTGQFNTTAAGLYIGGGTNYNAVLIADAAPASSLTLDASGVLSLNQGQIQFPETAVPSANANTLDDYEEGTWTPALAPQSSGSITLNGTFTGGTYTKIGNLVTVNGCLIVSSVSSPVGELQITGLPFTQLSGNTNYRGGVIYSSGLASTSNAPPQMRGNPGNTTVTITTRYSSGAATTNASDIQAGVDMRFSITYQV